ncbi:unnamed protein product [Lasius platythorax]|uniref:Uncharacterized protein n=1 Tax=Lasius platythorax TaxID=488582 RepID=A0AAV2MZQ3_9HYME
MINDLLNERLWTTSGNMMLNRRTFSHHLLDDTSAQKYRKVAAPLSPATRASLAASRSFCAFPEDETRDAATARRNIPVDVTTKVHRVVIQGSVEYSRKSDFSIDDRMELLLPKSLR